MGGAASISRDEQSLLQHEIKLLVTIKGDGEIFASELKSKHLKHSLLHIVIEPFLRNVAKERKNNELYTLQMLAEVQVAGTTVGLNAGTSALSIHSTTGEIISTISGSSSTASEPVKVTLTMHNDSEKARPRFIARLAGGLVNPQQTRFKVFLGQNLGFSTELNRKWLSKPAREALVLPFLEFYHSAALGPRLQNADVVGLKIDGVVSPSGAEALHSPPKDFITPGGVTHVHILVRPELIEANPTFAMMASGASSSSASRGAAAADSSATRSVAGGSRANQRQVIAPKTPAQNFAPLQDPEANPLANILEQISFQRQ